MFISVLLIVILVVELSHNNINRCWHFWWYFYIAYLWCKIMKASFQQTEIKGERVDRSSFKTGLILRAFVNPHLGGGLCLS